MTDSRDPDESFAPELGVVDRRHLGDCASVGLVVVDRRDEHMWREEVYNTPPGSVGDTLCSALVQPVVHRALIASIPTLVAALGGFVSIWLRRRDLFFFALATPFGIVVIATFSLTAIF